MALPLDGDGFLRRQCGACQREFKWLCSDDSEQTTPVPEGGYHCPYCGAQADADSWFTEAQIRLAEQITATELGPAFLKGFAEQTGMRYEPGPPIEVKELGEEPNDMRRIDFGCHCDEPAKIAEDWPAKAHCPICGGLAS